MRCSGYNRTKAVKNDTFHSYIYIIAFYTLFSSDRWIELGVWYACVRVCVCVCVQNWCGFDEAKKMFEEIIIWL